MTLPGPLAERLASMGPMMQIFVDTLSGASTAMSLDELRAIHRSGLGAMPVADGVSFEQVDMAGVPGLHVIPPNPIEGRALLYFHGGAYIVGDPEGYKSFVSFIATITNMAVFVPNYRLAPEHPFPQPIDDCVTAYRWLLERGVASEQIIFMGDSAGGALTVSVMSIAKSTGLPLPLAGVALSPWANLTHSGSSMQTRADRDLIHAGVPDALQTMARVFLAGAAAENPNASPVFGDLSGLPPILIQVGEAEQLLSDGFQLSERLAEHGVRVTLEVWPEMFHGWQMYHGELEEAAAAMRTIVSFIDASFAG